MSELENLIIRIQQGINENRSFIKTIRHPQLLVASLQEFHEMIGNDKVKDAIAMQISHLIMVKRRAMEHPEMKGGDVMLNIVLKGPAGSGKTSCGIKIAKILYSLGYIDGSKNPKEKKQGMEDILKGMFGESSGSTTSTDNSALVLYILFIFIIILVTFISLAWSFYEKFGGIWTIVAILAVVFLIILFGYWISVNLNSSNETSSNTNNIQNNEKKNDECKEKDCPASLGETRMPADDQIIKVISRSELIGQYVGWTAPKVNKLLTENLGKIVFIDEAYSLLNSLDDQFGIECLTALNLFMSQHPNEIIIIFAGYKDKLEAGVFLAQPGLKRRFMYHFECDGYNAEQLFRIFKYQLSKGGWGLINEEEILKLFVLNKNSFPAYGGDTERLTHFAEVEHSRDYLANGEGMKLNKLAPIHVKRGIDKLKENTVENEHLESDSTMSNLMRMMNTGGYQKMTR